MFVGHYGVSFALKARDPRIPLWVLFLAVQLLDLFWAPFVLLGIEKVRIVPGITAASPLDLYYMPYTHSLLAAILWSAAAYAAYRLWDGDKGGSGAALLVALAVFSHWVLDFVVHRPDLALYDDTMKVGLGLWNRPVLALIVEAGVLFGGIGLALRHQPKGRATLVGFGVLLMGVQATTFWSPPPSSDRVIAIIALACYVVFAGIIAWWERRSGQFASAAEEFHPCTTYLPAFEVSKLPPSGRVRLRRLRDDRTHLRSGRNPCLSAELRSSLDELGLLQ